MNFLSRLLSFASETFSVGYNEGLLGTETFSTLSEAILHAEESSALYPRVVVTNSKGELLASFD